MQQHEIHHYLWNFFKANDCEILQRSPHRLDVQLTIEMDKRLMNRPFYWHYLEKTGGIPNPMQLSLITDPNHAEEEGELIHYGSPRLHQIFQTTKELGSYIRLFEDAKGSGTAHTPLHPWFGVNVKVCYQCDRKKDMLHSIGIHLISGAMVKNFHETLTKISFTPKIPDFCFTLTPIIKPQSGLQRIEDALTNMIETDDHTWAKEARIRWNHDLELLKRFYEESEELPESYEIEKQALKEQYEPRITMQIINGGLFYVTASHFLS
ncbi:MULTISPECIES: YqhG family protein [unclassified Bacillus cereus group]|uniref:YqhG family protein n=1 Tax=unclassified Bacillus cereus group TaxID=2750818 RepID=UPI001F55F051|nr:MULTISPECIES: YqhG family protein [unclassified Bacillus cereus group]